MPQEGISLPENEANVKKAELKDGERQLLDNIHLTPLFAFSWSHISRSIFFVYTTLSWVLLLATKSYDTYMRSILPIGTQPYIHCSVISLVPTRLEIWKSHFSGSFVGSFQLDCANGNPRLRKVGGRKESLCFWQGLWRIQEQWLHPSKHGGCYSSISNTSASCRSTRCRFVGSTCLLFFGQYLFCLLLL